MLDNFRFHHSKLVEETDSNPIEFIWKSVKRIVSVASINSEDNLKDRLRESLLELSTSRTFAKSWKRKFLTASILA